MSEKRKRVKNEQKKNMKKWRPAFDEDGIATQYHESLNKYFDASPATSRSSLQLNILSAAEEADARLEQKIHHPWMTYEIHDLIQTRRREKNKMRRKMLSKAIQKKTKQAIRKWKDNEIERISDDFKDLNRFERIGIEKKSAEDHNQLSDDDFAQMLQEIFKDDHDDINAGNIPEVECMQDIPKFDLEELERALSKFTNGKSADKHGIVMEMLKYGNDNLKMHIVSSFYDILAGNFIEISWLHIFFNMIPKEGNLSEIGH